MTHFSMPSVLATSNVSLFQVGKHSNPGICESIEIMFYENDNNIFANISFVSFYVYKYERSLLMTIQL